jgi:hypothetical protein
MKHEFDSWTDARCEAQQISVAQNEPVAIYKPFNSDTYALAVGARLASIAYEHENFVEWIDPQGLTRCEHKVSLPYCGYPYRPICADCGEMY